MKINARLILLNIALTLVLMLSLNLLSNFISFIASQVSYAVGFEKPIGMPKFLKNGDSTQQNIYREFYQLQTRYEPFIGWSIKPFYGLTTNIDANIEDQYKTVYPIIKTIIQKRGHDWIFDYTDLFSGDESIDIDFAHVFEKGNRIIAEQLYKDIKTYDEVHPKANHNAK
jgi:hypothetical protein